MIIGASGTGKTSIANCFINKHFNEHNKVSVGVEFYHKDITIEEKAIKVVLWDTAGQ